MQQESAEIKSDLKLCNERNRKVQLQNHLKFSETNFSIPEK